ncbi:c-type cytochrome [Geomesophilobacter sediminis]|uniref:Cytochrome C n=1 Tax=Geomesophilobacter sediminis TaxID=2798584 RepID=A0A8J7LZA9_9BACT|nr:cytochrome C [Geomesophilobacter sediminis]MBJ6726091.1 cytochrome C [Geomesophilobacter sediminis]
MKKLIITILLIPPLALAVLYLVVLYEGPRMVEQPHVRTFQAVLPPLPPGVVPVQAAVSVPSAQAAAGLVNPLPADPAIVAQGSVYYQYYCIFCHGEHGAGNGPVGQSYVPRPADLHSARVRGFTDGQLLREMLTGVGHEPVLERVVKPRHRWPLVLYVRALGVAHP